MTEKSTHETRERPEDELSDGAIRDAIRRTYDANQRAAIRLTCATCGKPYDVTNTTVSFEWICSGCKLPSGWTV